MHAPTHCVPCVFGKSGVAGTSTRLNLRVCESVSLIDESTLWAVVLGSVHLFWPPSGFKYMGYVSLSIYDLVVPTATVHFT